MTVKQLIDSLQSSGHNVQYKKRTDGSYLIKSIDKNTYKGSKGNIAARSILGVKLSKAKTAQLKASTKKRKTAARARRAAQPKFSKALEKQFKRTQRKWRKNVKDKSRITKKKARWILENEGAKELRRKLSRLEKHAERIAYPEEVDGYLLKLGRVMMNLSDDDIYNTLLKAYSIIEKRKNNFKYDWLEVIQSKYPSKDLYLIVTDLNSAKDYLQFIKQTVGIG